MRHFLELGNSMLATRCLGCREALVFLAIEAGDNRIARHERRQGATIEIVGQNPQIFRIGTDVSFRKKDTARLQKALGFGAGSTTGLRVEMNLHWRTTPIAIRTLLYQM
jgi:hypothetical protein